MRFPTSVTELVCAAGWPTASQRQPFSIFTYKSSPLLPMAVMFGRYSQGSVSAQRACRLVASVTKRTQMPAELRLKSQTGWRTTPSAFAGKRS